jgi:hypothetical protein
MAEEITALRDERDELKVRELGGSIYLQPFGVELADPLYFFSVLSGNKVITNRGFLR